MALSGIVVLEIAGLAPVPFCGLMLADFGATVIRVDRPNAVAVEDVLSRGKTSVAIDLKAPKGRALFLEMVKKADVVLDPFRPGVLERLGLCPQKDLLAANPMLIVGRISGFGQSGPLRGAAGHDINFVAQSGSLSLCGPDKTAPPVPPLNWLGDFAGGGALCAFGVVAALLERQRSGQGQVVDASMTEGAAYLSLYQHLNRSTEIWRYPRGENVLDGAAPFYTVYETADRGRYMAVGSVEPKFFSALLHGLGLEEAEFVQMDRASWPKQRAAIAAAFSRHPRAHWEAVFSKLDACVSPVLELPELPTEPTSAARKMLLLNPLSQQWEPAPAPRMSRTPADPQFQRSGSAILRPGAHTRSILCGSVLRLSESEFNNLVTDGIIEDVPTTSRL